MGGMTKQPHTEDPSVFGEMQKTYHKGAMKDFKPSVPPSIMHPHSASVAGASAIPAEMKGALHPPAPKSEMGSFSGAVEEGEETEEQRILNRQKHQEPVGEIGDKIRGILAKSDVPGVLKRHFFLPALGVDACLLFVHSCLCLPVCLSPSLFLSLSLPPSLSLCTHIFEIVIMIDTFYLSIYQSNL